MVASVSYGTEAMNGTPHPPWYDAYAQQFQQAAGPAMMAPVGQGGDQWA